MLLMSLLCVGLAGYPTRPGEEGRITIYILSYQSENWTATIKTHNCEETWAGCCNRENQAQA